MSRTVASVLFILLLKCWSAVCSRIYNGSMLPDYPYVLIGKNITLTCSHYTEDNTSLTILGPHDSKFPPEYFTEVSPHVLQLDLPIKNESWQGKMINCFDDLDDFFNRGIILKVEYPPRNMTNVTALIDNWKTLNIWWNIPKYFDMANIKVDVKWKTLNGWYNCSEGSSITNCFINENYYLKCPVYWFRINITNTEADVSHVQDVRIQSNRYVKAAPPKGLSTTTSSRCLTATWENITENTQTWEYAVHLDNLTNSRREVNDTTVTICELRPDTEYVLSVTSKPDQSIYWSLPSRITDRTAEDKPDASVPVMDGGYYVKNSSKDGNRTIVIFLTTPLRNTWNGNLTEFRVSYFPLNGRKEITRPIPVTSLNDTVDLKCKVAYTVEITLYNSIGASPTSKLRIPVHEAVSKPARVRVRISGETGKLEWRKEESVHSQAVFWCQGTLIPFSCKGRTQWKSVPETHNSTSITYAAGNIYGVSITTDKGSSGISWADCTYILEKEPSIIPVPTIDVPSENSMTVKWNPETCSENVLVTHYIIEHCDVNNITACVTNMVRSEDGKYTIPDLKAGVNYSARLRKVTVDGKEGDYSDHVYATPLFPGGNPQQKGIWILAVILGVFGFVAIIIGIVRFRKVNLNEPIDMPRSDQALNDPTTQTFNALVVVEENGVDPTKKASEKLIAQENCPDIGFISGSSPKEAHSAETHFFSESEFKELVQVRRDSKGSCGDSKIIKEERASECHDEEEDTSEQVNVWYSIVAGRDDEQEECDEEEEANQDDEDQCNVDAEEPDKFDVEDQVNLDEDESNMVAVNPENLDYKDQSNLDKKDRGNLDKKDRGNLGAEDRFSLNAEN